MAPETPNYACTCGSTSVRGCSLHAHTVVPEYPTTALSIPAPATEETDPWQDLSDAIEAATFEYGRQQLLECFDRARAAVEARSRAALTAKDEQIRSRDETIELQKGLMADTQAQREADQQEIQRLTEEHNACMAELAREHDQELRQAIAAEEAAIRYEIENNPANTFTPALRARAEAAEALLAQRDAEIATLKDALVVIANGGPLTGQTTGPMKMYQAQALARARLEGE